MNTGTLAMADVIVDALQNFPIDLTLGAMGTVEAKKGNEKVDNKDANAGEDKVMISTCSDINIR